jgi:nitrogen fixation NifU-like protein
MFSAAVLDHFKNPRNAGELRDATAVVEASNPVCGDVLRLAVRIENGRIAEARFLCRGCTTAIACGSLLTELISNQSVEQLATLDASAISARLGELPQATFHGAQLAADASAQLLAKLRGA